MSWRLRTLQWIAEQEKLNAHMNRDQLRKHCSKNYPFHQRRGSAYKGFLAAMSEKFGSRTRDKRQQKLL